MNNTFVPLGSSEELTIISQYKTNHNVHPMAQSMIKRLKVKRPSDQITLVEGGPEWAYNCTDDKLGTYGSINSKQRIHPTLHNNGANYPFLDGHVQSLSGTEFYATTGQHFSLQNK